MDRRDFITGSALSFASMMTLSSFKKITDEEKPSETMPVLFIGHGSPMNAIEDNEFSKGWKKTAGELQKPSAVLCVSAHWQTQGTKVTAMEKPKTIHDFYGFPEELNKKEYPAPGSPELAKETKEKVKSASVELDSEWGLDHGAWSVLLPMFPKAEIPVFQLSLDYSKGPEYHFNLAKELASFREKGVLIIGSGNIVHNLGKMEWKETAFDWAVEFDSKIKEAIEKNDTSTLINYSKLGKSAELSVPTNEHYLPLLYAMALRKNDEKISFFNEKTTMGSVSMRSVRIG